jgi:hypothetical protein
MTQDEKRIKIADYLSTPDIHDYFNDLNACHEMEKAMTYEQRYQYAKHFIDFEIVFATATQRAEAFGLTLNLWTNEPN